MHRDKINTVCARGSEEDDIRITSSVKGDRLAFHRRYLHVQHRLQSLLSPPSFASAVCYALNIWLHLNQGPGSCVGRAFAAVAPRALRMGTFGRDRLGRADGIPSVTNSIRAPNPILPTNVTPCTHWRGKQRQRSSRSNRPRADTITHSGLYPKMTKRTFNLESEILEAKDQAKAAFSWAE